MSLPVHPLTADFHVAPQLDPASMQAVADAGYRSVVNNRPDGEGGPSQPTSAAVEAAARAAGLAYAYLPVHPSLQTPEEAAQLKALIAALPHPILAFCRSGARSTKLFDAANAL